jgi:hypothetical protein
MVSLVDCRQTKEICRGTCCGGRAFLPPPHSRHVVMDCVSGEAGEVHQLAQNVVLGHSGCELQIADADGATRVGRGDQFRGDANREGFSPQERATAGKEKYTTHASP